MKPFGEKWQEPEEEMAAPSESGTIAASAKQAGGMCIPVVVLVAMALVLVSVVSQSGANPPANSQPKALVVVLDGLKGTTFDEIGIAGFRAPNLRELFANGKRASCVSPHDPRCARAQSGAALGGKFAWGSASGIASVLTGVDAAKHGVYNDSAEALSGFTAAARQHPTFMAVAKKHNLRTAAVGSGHLLTSVGRDTDRCTDVGLLDMECGGETMSRCLLTKSCNVDSRFSVEAPATAVHDVAAGTDVAAAANPDEADIDADVEAMLEAEADVLMLHLPNLRAVADHSAGSRRYAAELYKADAIVGRALQRLRHRAEGLHENWLVLVVSDRGSASGVANDADLVAFGGAALTAAGPLRLRLPTVPTRQFDVAPTLLRWFGLLDQPTAERMDGRVQLLCSAGSAIVNCTDV